MSIYAWFCMHLLWNMSLHCFNLSWKEQMYMLDVETLTDNSPCPMFTWQIWFWFWNQLGCMSATPTFGKMFILRGRIWQIFTEVIDVLGGRCFAKNILAGFHSGSGVLCQPCMSIFSDIKAFPWKPLNTCTAWNVIGLPERPALNYTDSWAHCCALRLLLL